MITLGEMQISGMLTMTVLAVMLALCVPRRSKRGNSFGRARWMMAAGTGLIALQFLLQHTFGFRQMGVAQRQLQEWLRQSEYGKLAELVASLRIEEAQRVLKDHPDWSIETVADHCGFNDRKYFHEVFRQHTGMTPLNFQRG
jgi:methylphosphotriester-DNA--protein-cysteine methyltransferase